MIVDPYVKFIFRGVPDDNTEWSTKAVSNNGFHPVWNDTHTVKHHTRVPLSLASRGYFSVFFLIPLRPTGHIAFGQVVDVYCYLKIYISLHILTLQFTVHCWELCHLAIMVMDHDTFSKDDLLCYNSIPLSCLVNGYQIASYMQQYIWFVILFLFLWRLRTHLRRIRFVPLLNKQRKVIPVTGLFCEFNFDV